MPRLRQLSQMVRTVAGSTVGPAGARAPAAVAPAAKTVRRERPPRPHGRNRPSPTWGFAGGRPTCGRLRAQNLADGRSRRAVCASLRITEGAGGANSLAPKLIEHRARYLLGDGHALQQVYARVGPAGLGNRNPVEPSSPQVAPLKGRPTHHGPR